MTVNVVFLGTPDFAVPAFEALFTIPDVSVRAVVTQPDRPAGRGGKVQASPVKEAALRRRVPVIQPHSVKKELDSVLKDLSEHGPVDIAIVVAFGQILPKGMLDFPRRGCINIHASLLPRWRGAAPIQRALLAGDSETGVCLMKMDEGLDTGPVYSREAVAISDSDTGGDLHDRLSSVGARLLARDLFAIVRGEIAAEPQPEQGVTYASKITPADTVIDWSKTNRELQLQIRALAPFPGAFTLWRGKRLKMFRSRCVEVRTGPGKPGEILVCQDERLVVGCGAGALLVEELQLEGKKRMPADELLRGTSFSPGEVLAAQ
jgi:methionyl-tRNA formyltransferase